METLVETLTHGDIEIEIHVDSHPESPREWDNLGTIITWNRRYNLGDIDGNKEHETPQDFVTWAEENNVIFVPVYLLDHSGLTVSTEQFSCPWDSGKLGWIYVTQEKLNEEYGEITDETIKKAKEILILEINTLDQFLTGEVYGYIAKHLGEELDSCWGFYGIDYIKEQATEDVKYWEEQIKKQQNDWADEMNYAASNL